METRTRLAIGGTTALAVSAAVVASVVVTNVAVLAESPGTPVRTAVVEIRPVPQVSVTPVPEAGPSDIRVVTTPVPSPPPVAETVPAPAPVVVPAPAAPAPAPPNPVPVADADTDEAASIDQARTSGRWDLLYVWAEEHGWPRTTIDRWVEQAQDAKPAPKPASKPDHVVSVSDQNLSHPDPDASLSTPPEAAEKTSVPDTPQRGDGSKRDRSHGPPDSRD